MTKKRFEIINIEGKKYFKKIYLEDFELYADEVNMNNYLEFTGIFPKVIDINDNEHSIIFEVVEGKKLSDINLSNSEIVNILIKISKSISIMHDNFVVHCDLKPDNILVNGNDVTIIDLASAKMFGEKVKTRTFKYSSVEQIEGKIANKSMDIYSLGIIMYELFTKRKDFFDKNREGFEEKLSEYLSVNDYNPDIPYFVEHILLRTITTDLEYKYNDIYEFISDLEILKEQINDKDEKLSVK